MTPRIIDRNSARGLDWPGAIEALRHGHLAPAAQVRDLFLGPGSGSLLTRAAWLPGRGFGVKAVTVFGDNPARGLPSVQGAMLVFDPETGALTAVIDAPLVTEYKTCADSVLGAQILARPDSRRLLVVGAGVLAGGLVAAYRAGMPHLDQIQVWARRPEQARALADRLAAQGHAVTPVTDLAEAVAGADIVSTATMAREPLLRGEWVRPGTHVDLIGAFRADMREADDALMTRARIFVDSRATTIAHIGELAIPIAAGMLTPDDVLGDLYDLVPGACGRTGADQITVYKNGGGAHLDTMIAAWIAVAT